MADSIERTVPAEVSSPIRVGHDYHPDHGSPTGGYARGLGIDIVWQDGPMTETPPNGAFVEDVVQIAIDRLRFFQDSEFRCRENALALTKLEEAYMWMRERRRNRAAAGTLGTYNP